MEAQQQQQYHYQYQTQPQPDTLISSQSYDPTQIQPYDQSYYAYQQHPSTHYNQAQAQQSQPQQQDYSSYYYQDYSSSYQTDPNSVHPPGVPISADSQQTHLQDAYNVYYPHGVVAAQPAPPHSYYAAGGSQAGRSVRGRGTFGRYGRGRGGGRGKAQSTRSSAAAASGGAQSVEGQAGKPPPRMAWCELCRVDCTTLEVLEQHKNGKRHQRNLKVHGELQNLSRQLTMQNPTMSVSQPNPETIPPQIAVVSNTAHPPNNNDAPNPATVENQAEGAVEKDIADKSEASGALPSQESVRRDHFGGRGGLKRRARGGGRGGKWMRGFDGSRRPMEPPKPKPMVPLICDLCNVKCESQVVFESHIAGKKHISNVKRFQGHKEAFGEGIQALYPTIPNLPSTSIIPQANQQVVAHDAQALASLMLSQQNLQDPQAAQAALASLLHQHGIHDAQTLITQLVPYLVAQFQSPGSLPLPEAGSGVPNQNFVSQGADISSIGAESHNVGVTEEQNVTSNVETEEQNVTSNVETEEQNVTNNVETEQNPQAVAGANDKPADVPPENES